MRARYRKPDLIDTTIDLERRVRAMETRANPYYLDPDTGVTDELPTPVAVSPSWSTRYIGLQGQVIADTVTLLGMVRPNVSPPTSDQVCVVPERLWPDGVVRASFRHRDLHTLGTDDEDAWLLLDWTVEPDGVVTATAPDWHGNIGWYNLAALSWPFGKAEI
jgi:hypothetical protein